MTNKQNSDQHLALHDHDAHLDKVLEAMPKEKSFALASEVFQQLCDPTRLRILWLLAHSEQCVNNISVAINMSASAVSHHLRVLRQAGLIVNRREGKEIYYKLAQDRMSTLIHKMIDDVFEISCPCNEGK